MTMTDEAREALEQSNYDNRLMNDALAQSIKQASYDARLWRSANHLHATD